MELKELAERASTLLRIPARFIASWWVAENGWHWPFSNNPGNISYTGSGKPDPIGVFAGVTEVYENQVCRYATAADGVNAFVLLLELPLTSKELTLTAQTLRDHANSVRELCNLVGASNWAASHYQPVDSQGVPIPGSWQGESIWDVYICADMASMWNDHPMDIPHDLPVIVRFVTEESGQSWVTLARRYRIPVSVLEDCNGPWQPGKEARIPVVYRVQSGDTLDAIAKRYRTTAKAIGALNHIGNLNLIRQGQTLYI